MAWRRERLPTPVFLGFPCGSAGKESTCNVGDLDPIPGLGRFPWRRERLPTPVFWPGKFQGLYSSWGRTWLSNFHFPCSCVTSRRMAWQGDLEPEEVLGQPVGWWASQVPRWVKNPPANAGNAGEVGSIPGSGRSPREGNGNPLRYSCLGNPTDRGAWWATAHGVVQSRTRLSAWAHTWNDGVTLGGDRELGWWGGTLVPLRELAGRRRRGAQPISARSAQTAFLPMTAAICALRAPRHPPIQPRGDKGGPAHAFPTQPPGCARGKLSDLISLAASLFTRWPFPPPSHLWAPHHSPHLPPHPWDFRKGRRHPPGDNLPLNTPISQPVVQAVPSSHHPPLPPHSRPLGNSSHQEPPSLSFPGKFHSPFRSVTNEGLWDAGEQLPKNTALRWSLGSVKGWLNSRALGLYLIGGCVGGEWVVNFSNT